MKANDLSHLSTVSSLTLLKQFENYIVRLYISKNIFYTVPISVAFVSEIKAVSRAGVAVRYCFIDSKLAS